MYWLLLTAIFAVWIFAAWIGQKAIQRYLGRTPESENKIYAAGVRVAALFLLFALPLRMWTSFDNPLYSTIGLLVAFTIGEFAAQALFGKRTNTL